MTIQTLEDKIQASGGAMNMLRHSATGAYPFPMASEYTNWRDEQASWHNTAVMFDMGLHMTDIYFRGPDTDRLLSRVGVNRTSNFGTDKAKQFVAVDEDGNFIADAILFGLEDSQFSLVGSPVLSHWVAYQAETGNYDVEVVRDERTLANSEGRRTYRYQIQGPNALKIVEKAAAGTLPAIRFFNIGRFSIGGTPVRALNHTMVGIPGQEHTGLEIWGPLENKQRVLETLVAAGEEFGLHLGGAMAYSTTGLESGWMGFPCLPGFYAGESTVAYRRHMAADSFEGTASLGGSFHSDETADYFGTPWDVGYGRLIDFDHEFIGRDALKRRVDEPHKTKVWLRWNDADVREVISRSLFGGDERTKFMTIPYAVFATYQQDSVLVGDNVVGTSNRTGYTVNVGGWSSLAVIDAEYARDGVEVSVVWGEPVDAFRRPNVERHVQTVVRATVSTTALA